jgi:assimilatory nitrate reductase catalytic subunit
MTEVRSTCPYCGVGCGIVAKSDGTIAGDPQHPANRGRLCSKGAALAATLDDGGRLLHPMIGGRNASWDEALDLIAVRFREVISEHGPDSVAFYVSGQCLTEDYYVANKLMKGFIGSANIDTNSRLCMASSVAGHVRAFGEDIVPGIYEDWDNADLVVLVGSNAAWCHPVLHQRLLAARAAHGTRIVVIDPRRTATADAADLHLPIASGSDIALFTALLAYLDDAGAVDRLWVRDHAAGLEEAIAAATIPGADLTEWAAQQCGIDPELLETFFDMFARTERVLTVFSQGVNQSSAGTDKVNAIINVHLATGRIGRAGMGPFSVTGQPNAMGGREVGGLATQLAAHLGFDDPGDRAALTEFWHAPALAPRPGLKAVDMFEAVADGRIKAIWIAATNPAASMPRAGKVRDALAACPFVVVSDCWATDTTRFADVLLPTAGWGEKDGTVTNSERLISRQRAFRPAPGKARPDWWQFAEIGRRMGWGKDFAWTSAAAVFREHAALSGYANEGRRVFDIGALADLDDSAYDALQPVRWPVPAGAVGDGGRLFAHGGFPTQDGRARMVPVAWSGRPDIGGRALLLNTGRVRDQWHTMTRTGLAPNLMTHTPEPLLAMNPADAAARGIETGSLTRVATDEGTVLLRAEVTHGQRRGEVYAPMHWTDQFSFGGPLARVVGARLDPVSGQPELKATPADVERVPTRLYGTLLRRTQFPLGGSFGGQRGIGLASRHRDTPMGNPGVPPGAFLCGYTLGHNLGPTGDRIGNPMNEPSDGSLLCHWVRIPLTEGHLYRLTGLSPMPEGEALTRYAAALLGAPDGEWGEAEWLEVADPKRGIFRVAALVDGAVEAALFLARDQASVPPEPAVIPVLGAPVPDSARGRLLAGRLYDKAAAEGPRVCACFGVTRDAIRHAVVTHRLKTSAEIGVVLGAGTNCGSCVPELEEILRHVSMPAA